MKANQFYRQWITDYRKENNDRGGEPIQDGDLLDWIAQKFETGEFKQLNKPVVMQAKGQPCQQCEGIGRVVDDDFTGETIPCETCGGAAVASEGEEKPCADGHWFATEYMGQRPARCIVCGHMEI